MGKRRRIYHRLSAKDLIKAYITTKFFNYNKLCGQMMADKIIRTKTNKKLMILFFFKKKNFKLIDEYILDENFLFSLG